MADPYVPPSGSEVPLSFGGAYTPPVGDRVPLEFVRTAGPPGETQYTFPQTWASSFFGTHRASNWTEYLRPTGWASQALGAHSIANNARLVRPAAWASQAVGAAVIRNVSQGIFAPSIQTGVRFGTAWASNWRRNISPAGAVVSLWGQPRIFNLIQHIRQAGNIPPRLAFGTAQVVNLNRFIRPAGVLGTAFGVTFVSHGERSIRPGSILAPNFGTAWASHSPRRITPAGLYATSTGLAKVGGTRRIYPEGFDASRYGTRIIPEVQSVYPQGMATLWGLATAFNVRQIARPAGFITQGAEGNRFGQHLAFNARQYIRQVHSEASEAIGEVFGRWSAIENRNRTVRTFGHDSAVVPRQYIENGARDVRPGGALATAFGQAFVAPAIREFRPEPIEAPYIGGWTAVRNTASVVRATGTAMQAWGAHAIFNTRRRLERIGNRESLEMGEPFVSFARRELRVEGRHGIGPPSIPLPQVNLWRRYVEAGLGDQAGYGSAFLHIHWNKVYPRWGDVSRYGMPAVRNVTPEVLARGRDQQEHGTPTIMLFKRYVRPIGMAEQPMARPLIRDRRSWIRPVPFNAATVSTQARIENLQPDPPITRWLYQSTFGNEHLRMGEPALNQQVLYHLSPVPMTLWGETAVFQNVVQPVGIYDFFATGTPDVSFLHRRIEPEGIESTLEIGKPRFNPHTVWATEEATAQAIENHASARFHPVDYPPEGALKAVGRPTVSLRHRLIRNVSAGAFAAYGLPRMVLRRQYIRPEGWRLSRVGWHEIPQFIRYVRQYDSPRTDLFGATAVRFAPYTGPQTIRPAGMREIWGATRIELLNRPLHLSGWLSQAMGASGAGPQYMRQRLWVGAPDWPKTQGFDASLFGQTWISLRVRELKPEGFDSFIMDYDLQHFDWRMRVRRGVQAGSAARSVSPAGWAEARLGTPGVRHRVHFIRPDGNSDQFRKGAPTWPM